jgi:dGTPase
MADTISYIGRDIEDAIRLGLIKRDDLPDNCTRVLGNTNGTIIYTLVEDLVNHSLDKPYISFSAKVGQALKDLKTFNQKYIYTSKRVKEQSSKIRLMLELLFRQYYQDLEQRNGDSDIFKEFLEGMSPEYRSEVPRAEIVRDFIAGMTDDYFLERCQENLIPQVRSTHFTI